MPVLSAETLSLPVSALWMQLDGHTLSITAFRYSSILHYTTAAGTLQGFCEKKSGNLGNCMVWGVSWGNLFEEKVSPNPFQNLFTLWLPVCLAGMMGRGKRKKFRGVRLKSVRSVDMGLVLISTKIVLGKSGSAKTLTSRAMQRLHDLVRCF